MLLPRQTRVGLFIACTVLLSLAFMAVLAWERHFGAYTLGAGVALFVALRLLRLVLLKRPRP